MSRRRTTDLPRKTDPTLFGGGRVRGVYTQKQIDRLLCCVRGCGRGANAAWSACCDDNVQRPVCPEHDCEMNFIAISMTGDPDGPGKLDAYIKMYAGVIGRDIEVTEAMWAYLNSEAV